MLRYLVLVVVLALPACSLPPSRDARGGVDSMRTSAVPQSSAPISGGVGGPDIAVAQLPYGAGSIARVRERHYANGVTQEIVLSGGTHGENRIDIAVQKSTGRAREALVPMGKPTEGGIKGEIAGRFPDVAMRIVNRAMQNSYGEYGLAIGRHADGTRCIFAWQWIDSVRGASPRGGGVRSLLGGGSPASVRVRLCRGDATADQLAAYVDGLEIGAPASLDRVWQAEWESAPLEQQGGLLSAAVQDNSLDRALGGGGIRAPVSPVINAPKYRARHSVRKPEASEPSVRRGNVAPQNDGPYLAPLSPGEAAVSRNPQGGGGSPSLDPSVPSRAYRGPARSAPAGAPARRGTIDQSPAQNAGVKVPPPSEPVKSEPKKQDVQQPAGQQAPSQQAPAGGAKGGLVPPPPP
jgi:hypothetical protein